MYKYETHAHTSECSACSVISAKDIVRFYKSLGYGGICITDHFFNGNTTVPQNLSWRDKVNGLCKGYNLALEEGKKVGLDVFFGWEYSYNGCDFLTYGLDEQWLYNNPQIIKMSLNDYLDFVRQQGAFVVHAHPFRDAWYIPMICLLPKKVDAVEVYNASNTPQVNHFADQYADNYGLFKSMGSDTHSAVMHRAGLEYDNKLEDIHHLIDTIISGEAKYFIE